MIEKEMKDREETVYYGCGHSMRRGTLSTGYDHQKKVLKMISDGIIPPPKEEDCPSCILDKVNSIPAIVL